MAHLPSRVMSDAERLVRELMGVHFEQGTAPPAASREPGDVTGVLELMATLASSVQ